MSDQNPPEVQAQIEFLTSELRKKLKNRLGQLTPEQIRHGVSEMLKMLAEQVEKGWVTEFDLEWKGDTALIFRRYLVGHTPFPSPITLDVEVAKEYEQQLAAASYTEVKVLDDVPDLCDHPLDQQLTCAQKDPLHPELWCSHCTSSLPCPHGRASWRMCPHCLGING